MLIFRVLTNRTRRGVCTLVLVFVSITACGQGLPSGWRRPSGKEIRADWREKSPTRFLIVKGDFDSDGKEDVAELLVNPSSHKFAVFVKLASNGQWQRIGKGNGIESFNNYGIAPVKPGRYKTACGKGYGDWACAHGEPDYLKLSNTAIDMFIEESSGWIVYWDPRSKTFRQTQISD